MRDFGLGALGAGGYIRGGYGRLAGTPTWITPPSGPVDPDAAMAARQSALGAITALWLGLVGRVRGGWLGSRTPMTSYALVCMKMQWSMLTRTSA